MIDLRDNMLKFVELLINNNITSKNCKFKLYRGRIYIKRISNEQVMLTVGPASNDVPESTIAAQPSVQKPETIKCWV